MKISLLLVAVLALPNAVFARHPEITDDSALAGSWSSDSSVPGTSAELKFADGAYESSLPDGTVRLSGRYEKLGNGLSFTDEAAACPRGAAGFYRFYIVEGELRFKAVNDPCIERLNALSRTWKRR